MYRWRIITGSLALIITDAFGMAIPWLIKDAIDSISKQRSTEVLARYAILIIGAALFQGVFRYFWRTGLFGVARRIEYHLRNEYFTHLLKLPQAFFYKNRTGDIISRGTNDLNAVRDLVGPGALIFVDTITLISVSLSLMLYINWRLTLVALLPMPLLSIVIYFVGDRIERTYEKMQRKLAELTARAQENIGGIRTIQSFRQEENEIRRFSKLSRDYVKYNMLMAKVNGIEEPIIFFITGTSMNVLLYFGGLGVMKGTNSVGELVALTGYLMLLAWPLFGLGWLVNLYTRGIASMERIDEILRVEPEIADGEATDRSIGSINGEVEFRDVSFTYPGKTVPSIKGVTFRIPRGKTMAITGHLGCGKSTICNLIPRFLDSSSGEILIDGTDIRKIPLDSLRGGIGYVRQEPFLFSDTIAENMRFGDSGAGQEELARTARTARVEEDIENFPEKYMTMLGERGVTVSGGQKQRLAICRALLKKPKVLILDDTLSAVDTRTEDAILSELRGIMKDCTAIIVSHRISSIMHADEIIVMDNGCVSERGTHRQLLENAGYYARTYHKQKLKFELETMD